MSFPSQIAADGLRPLRTRFAGTRRIVEKLDARMVAGKRGGAKFFIRISDIVKLGGGCGAPSGMPTNPLRLR
jgi:hypothetical protein